MVWARGSTQLYWLYEHVVGKEVEENYKGKSNEKKKYEEIVTKEKRVNVVDTISNYIEEFVINIHYLDSNRRITKSNGIYRQEKGELL